jgi:hypothetical protein
MMIGTDENAPICEHKPDPNNHPCPYLPDQ